MKDTILLGEAVKLDLQELITGRTFLSSVTRYGKSWTARRIVEQTFGKTGIIILDPEGEYSTLRDKYPLLIIGKDVPLVPEASEYLADQILEHELSVIVDLSDPQLELLSGQEFVSRFIDRFIALETKMRKPYLWILEEADEFAPERGTFKSASLQSVIKLTKKGAKRGLGVLVLTQRPAFISKYVISQCSNKIVGRMEWPDDIAVIKRYLRISDKISDKLSKVEKGEFYVSGDFIAKEGFVKVGLVETKHLGATPEVVPPAPRELKETLAKLSEALPKIVQEKLAPAVPKVAEIEARIKEKLEGAWQARVQRVEKERDAVKRRVEAKYEVENADLKRKIEELQKAVALKAGPIEDLLTHPLVKGRLEEKLSPQERSLVELLERKGPQGPEQIGLFLGVKSQSVHVVVSKANKALPGLIENIRGRYVSRLAKLFPVTEELKAEAKEIELLRTQLADRMKEVVDLKNTIQAINADYAKLNEDLRLVIKERDELAKKLKEVESRVQIPPTGPGVARATAGLPVSLDEARVREIAREELSARIESGVQIPVAGSGISVHAALKRTLSEFDVSINKERFEVDESSWTGKILARGIAGFFEDRRDFGQIMNELERVYSASKTSGGTREAVQKALDDLCAKGILDREQRLGGPYQATAEFKERVGKKT